MKTVPNLPGLLLLGFLAPMIFAQTDQKARARNAILAQRMDGVDLEYVSSTQAFSTALSKAGVPGGIVRVSGCDDDLISHRLQASRLSLRDVLDSIVKTDPRYRWSVDDGLINVLPTAREPDLLHTHVGEFRVDNVSWPSSALSRLMDTPEITASIRELGLQEALRAGSFPLPNSRKTERSVHCSNVTLREALNAIARTFGNAVWFYKEDHCNGKDQFSIDFIVE